MFMYVLCVKTVYDLYNILFINLAYATSVI